jgi:hypothetical protein
VKADELTNKKLQKPAIEHINEVLNAVYDSWDRDYEDKASHLLRDTFLQVGRESLDNLRKLDAFPKAVVKWTRLATSSHSSHGAIHELYRALNLAHPNDVGFDFMNAIMVEHVSAPDLVDFVLALYKHNFNPVGAIPKLMRLMQHSKFMMVTFFNTILAKMLDDRLNVDDIQNVADTLAVMPPELITELTYTIQINIWNNKRMIQSSALDGNEHIVRAAIEDIGKNIGWHI